MRSSFKSILKPKFGNSTPELWIHAWIRLCQRGTTLGNSGLSTHETDTGRMHAARNQHQPPTLPNKLRAMLIPSGMHAALGPTPTVPERHQQHQSPYVQSRFKWYAWCACRLTPTPILSCKRHTDFAKYVWFERCELNVLCETHNTHFYATRGCE